MNQEILFATHNRGKLAEARNYLSPLGYLVYGLDDLFLSEEVVEDGKSYEENAYKKAKAFESLPFPVFSDDSGLEVEALGGKPGLFTARFASEKGGYKEAMAFLAQATEGNPRARYVCTIFLLEKGQKKPLFFTGVCEGEILKEPVGDHGFGFDPAFKSKEGVYFGLASQEEKAKVSHRGRALLKLATYLAI